jgi:hypothetical protein
MVAYLFVNSFNSVESLPFSIARNNPSLGRFLLYLFVCPSFPQAAADPAALRTFSFWRP